MKKFIVAFVLLFPAVSYAEPISPKLQARLDKYVCSTLDKMVPDLAKSWRKNANVFEWVASEKNNYRTTLYIYPDKAELVIVSYNLMVGTSTYTSTHKCAKELYNFLSKWETAYLDKFLNDEGIE
jgi:hypothetical protein